ncbi:hypothetical protein MA16_Dca010771 [Dendrobium catenatum]|uniref:Uncharacterized protein n=1 Tax=Dendrobium catenatum TaxID=906689 RepID=A0A2I0VKG2_9ASPA|nr:hypothetical protein MA16_Dca010771 [Dendrobium catenatum]
MDGLDLVKFLGLDERIAAGNGVSAGRLEMEAARALLRVPVDPTVRRPALTLEPNEPNLFLAGRAPHRTFRLPRHPRNANRRIRRGHGGVGGRR